MAKTISNRTDFDGNWKGMITEFFEDFIAFFLPKLYPHVDFTQPHEFLDTELQNILESIGVKKRVLDKLIQVRLKNGTNKWILIHIEVQSYFEKLFAERMFLLFAMIFAKFRQKITALVIYTNKKTPKLYDCFEQNTFGTEVRYKFPSYKVAQQTEAELLKSENIFALFVLANLYVAQTGKNDRKRLLMKEKLVELAKERLIDLDKIRRLLIFVDGIMQLSKDLQTEFQTFIMDNYIKSRDPEVAEILERGDRRFIEAIWGDTLENLVAKETKELRQEYLAEKKLRIEAQKQQRKRIYALYHEKMWTIEQIAEFMEVETAYIAEIVKVKNKKK